MDGKTWRSLSAIAKHITGAHWSGPALLWGSIMRRIRCAIYTRKSSEEGLEQDFNSLDAQREACEAYIASQKHEGWRHSQTAMTTAASPVGILSVRHFSA